MFDKNNSEFVREMRNEFIEQIARINEQMKKNEKSYCDTDKDILRQMREKVIDGVDYINHLEMKEML